MKNNPHNLAANLYFKNHIMRCFSCQQKGPHGLSEMERGMKRKIMQFITLLLALLICLPATAGAVEVNPTIQVGLRYSSSVIHSANLLNETGSGYRLGYYNGDLEFIQLGSTDHKRLSV